MKTIIETDSYPVRVVLVPETASDLKAMEVLKANFCEDEHQEAEVEYEDPDDVLDYGKGVLVFSAQCNLH